MSLYLIHYVLGIAASISLQKYLYTLQIGTFVQQVILKDAFFSSQNADATLKKNTRMQDERVLQKIL